MSATDGTEDSVRHGIGIDAEYRKAATVPITSYRIAESEERQLVQQML